MFFFSSSFLNGSLVYNHPVLCNFFSFSVSFRRCCCVYVCVIFPFFFWFASVYSDFRSCTHFALMVVYIFFFYSCLFVILIRVQHIRHQKQQNEFPLKTKIAFDISSNMKTLCHWMLRELFHEDLLWIISIC